MIIHFIKFIHVLIALGLLGLTSYCFTMAGSTNTTKISRLNKGLLILSPLALITGTLLVYPKDFTFDTPWIQAAYIFLVIYAIALRILLKYNHKITKTWVWRLIYISLIAILIIIMHDAVTKNTLHF